MVLDTIKPFDSHSEFVFKNTYEGKEQVEMAMHAEEAPTEFFFVHIRYKTKDEKSN